MGGDGKDILEDFFRAYANSDCAKMESDKERRLDLALNKKKYEQKLDDMWDIYCKGNIYQLPIYNEQKDYIKKCGGRIFKNSQGKHKIIIS